MEKITKIPYYFPFIGIFVSIALIIIVASIPNTALLIAGLILLHLSVWTLAVKYFLCVVGFFSVVLDSK